MQINSNLMKKLPFIIALVCAFTFTSCNNDSKDEPSTPKGEVWSYTGEFKINGATMQLEGADVTDTRVELAHDATDAGVDTLKFYEVKFSPMQPFALLAVRLTVKIDDEGNISQVEDEQAAEWLSDGQWVAYTAHKFTETSGTASKDALVINTKCGSAALSYKGKK